MTFRLICSDSLHCTCLASRRTVWSCMFAAYDDTDSCSVDATLLCSSGYIGGQSFLDPQDQRYPDLKDAAPDSNQSTQHAWCWSWWSCRYEAAENRLWLLCCCRRLYYIRMLHHETSFHLLDISSRTISSLPKRVDVALLYQRLSSQRYHDFCRGRIGVIVRRVQDAARRV